MRALTTIGILLAATTATSAQFIPQFVSGFFPGEGFGTSVCDAGDVNGDGIGDFAVGAPGGGTLGEGMLYVFDGSTYRKLWRIPATLIAPPPLGGPPMPGGPLDQFGWSVAGLGDIDGDGVPDILVGAPQSAPNSGVGTGYATAISGATSTAIWTAYPTVPGFLVDSGFGFSVANAGDLDGDGISDAVIGAPFRDEPNVVPIMDAGVVQAFSGATGAPLGGVLGSMSESSTGGFSGWDVDGAGGDFDGDGVDDVIVGSFGVNTATVYSGATIVVPPAPMGPTALATFINPAPNFGWAVAGCGDLTLPPDGLAEVAVGSVGNLVNVYLGGVFGNPAPLYAFMDPSPNYGASLDAGTDRDNDGVPDILIGVRVIAGADAVDFVSGATGVVTQSFLAPPGAVGFGAAIAIVGDPLTPAIGPIGRLIIGAPSTPPGGVAVIIE